MKFIILILVITFTTLNASEYARSIRVGSYPSYSSAKNNMQKAEKFFYSHKLMRDYREEYNMKFKINKSGRYYMIILEPVTNKQAVQDILDVIREKYRSAYPKRIKLKHSKNKPEDKKEEKEVNKKESSTSQKIIPFDTFVEEKVEEAPAENNVAVETKVETESKPKHTEVKKEVVSSVKDTKIAEEKIESDTIINQYTLALGGIALLLAGIIFFLLRRYSSLKNKYNNMQESIENQSRILEEKEKFYTDVPSELRELISSVLGISQALLEGELPINKQENIEKIKDASEKAFIIVDDLFNITKLDINNLEIKNEAFDINSMLENIINETYLLSKHNNVDVVLEVDNDVPANVIGDANNLEQVLIQLLSNAIKYAKNGNAYIKIRKKDAKKDNITLEFSVIDDGIGISQDKLATIFDAKSIVSSENQEEKKVKYSALWVVKKIVEEMKGTMKVRSQLDVGTTFVINLDMKIVDVDDKRNYRLPSKEYLNKSVLIVDKTKNNVVSLLRAFKYFNYQTNVVPSLAGKVLSDNKHYDIIVVNQSQLDDFAIEKLQKLHFDNIKKTKIILTSYRFTKINNRILDQLDISGFLKIPFTQQSMLDTIIEMYGSKNASKVKALPLDEKDVDVKNNANADKKILVAEDNVLNHKILSSLLKKTGAQVTFATNGQEVIDLVESGNLYDLILMDIEMPVVNGYDATTAIRNNKVNAKTPIIALSARDDEESMKKAYSVGMQGYFKKPISIDDFYKKIEDVLSGKVIVEDSKIQEISSDEEKTEVLDNELKEEIQEELATVAEEVASKEEKSIEEQFVEDQAGVPKIKTPKKPEAAKSELTLFSEMGDFDGGYEAYKSALREFDIDYSESVDVFENFIKEENYQDAIVLIKRIKDSALKIGAYTLCESISFFEYELEKENSKRAIKALYNYEEHLSKLLKEIELEVGEPLI